MKDYSGVVYSIVKKIPQGKVLTYGNIAKILHIKSPRLVGRILHNNPSPAFVPCHRVVNHWGMASKNYAFGGEKAQLKKLKEEGAIFKNRRVDLRKSLWRRSN